MSEIRALLVQLVSGVLMDKFKIELNGTEKRLLEKTEHAYFHSALWSVLANYGYRFVEKIPQDVDQFVKDVNDIAEIINSMESHGMEVNAEYVEQWFANLGY